MEELQNQTYPAKVWFTSLVLNPVLLFIYPFFIDYGNSNLDFGFNLGVLFFVFAIGAVLSIPAFLLYIMAFKVFVTLSISTFTLKLLLSILAVFEMIITFYFFNRLLGNVFRFEKSSTFIIIYSIGILLSTLIYKLKNRPSADFSPEAGSK